MAQHKFSRSSELKVMSTRFLGFTTICQMVSNHSHSCQSVGWDEEDISVNTIKLYLALMIIDLKLNVSQA